MWPVKRGSWKSQRTLLSSPPPPPPIYISIQHSSGMSHMVGMELWMLSIDDVFFPARSSTASMCPFCIRLLMSTDAFCEREGLPPLPLLLLLLPCCLLWGHHHTSTHPSPSRISCISIHQNKFLFIKINFYSSK